MNGKGVKVLGALGMLTVWACAESVPSGVVAVPDVFMGAQANDPGNNLANGESFEVCKVYRGLTTGPGPTVTVNVQTVANGPNGTSTSFQTTLADGECKIIWRTGQEGETITVTEVVPTGFTASFVKEFAIRPAGSGTPQVYTIDPEVAGNSASGQATGSPQPSGTLIRFINTFTPPPPPPTGCTRTIGYWKNHAGFGPQPDVLSQYLPVRLGTSGGAKTVTVTNAAQAVSLLSMSGGASNGIVKLYAQMLAARLNIAAGANGSAVASTLAAADAFLALNDASAWAGLSKADKNLVNGWMSAFDDYNNGVTGPGHCD